MHGHLNCVSNFRHKNYLLRHCVNEKFSLVLETQLDKFIRQSEKISVRGFFPSYHEVIVDRGYLVGSMWTIPRFDSATSRRG